MDLTAARPNKASVVRMVNGKPVRMVNGKPVVTGRNAKRIKVIDGVMYELGEPDVLYLNDGQGRFRPVPGRTGLSWTRTASHCT
jgi:hypothetical protein